MLQVRQQYVAALRLAAVRASWIPLLLQARSPRELSVQAGGGICYRPGSLLQRRVKFPRALRYAYVILSIRMHSIWSATLPGARTAGQTRTFISAEGDIVIARRSVLLDDPSVGGLEVRHELAPARRTACGRQAACRKEIAGRRSRSGRHGGHRGWLATPIRD